MYIVHVHQILCMPYAVVNTVVLDNTQSWQPSEVWGKQKTQLQLGSKVVLKNSDSMPLNFKLSIVCLKYGGRTSMPGYFFVHFSEGQLRPVACGTLSFEGKNVSFLGKNASFFLIRSFFQFSSKERPAVL